MAWKLTWKRTSAMFINHLNPIFAISSSNLSLALARGGQWGSGVTRRIRTRILTEEMSHVSWSESEVTNVISTWWRHELRLELRRGLTYQKLLRLIPLDKHSISQPWLDKDSTCPLVTRNITVKMRVAQYWVVHPREAHYHETPAPRLYMLPSYLI